ncbi:serine/threonine-protein kinase [Streptomyces sp. NPDC093544]|uniref:serine/threonine-protein kinase n=1 Tax=Streptomyces sp. NPDC093544 TaxID=3155200 RepID=UPI003418A1A7
MQGLLLAGRYRLVETIGSGGMGRVWRAHDEVLHRVVAVKELTAALYVAESDRAPMLARTRAEARAAARINHPAVVTVHDVLDHDNRPWIVMELVEGNSLADEVKEKGRVEPAEAARIGLWVLRALRAAHAAGVLHRDVKPGNVLLAADRRVLLTDFGIAQVEGDTTITRTGEIVGSVDYLAPERVRGYEFGPSSDLWALGATLYTAVEGRSAFRRTTPLTTMRAVVEDEPEPSAYAGPLGPVIASLLRKDPALRPSAEEAEQMLAEAAEGRRPGAAQAYVPTQQVGSQLEGPGYSGHGGAPDGGFQGFHQESAGSAYPPVASVTGPTSQQVAHQAPLTSGSTLTPEPSTAPSPKRRRSRLLVLGIVLAALVGGGTVVALQKWDEGRQQDTGSPSASPSVSQSPTGSPTTSTTGGTEGSVPDSWVEINDPFGFGLSLPEGWKRSVFSDEGGLQQVDYTPDGSKHLLRIAVDSSPDFNDPYAHQVDLEKGLGDRLVDYEKVSLERGVYRDRQSSQLEWTWTALAKDTDFPGPYRAVDLMYIARSGVEYAFYMTAPADDWATAREQFETVLQSWREG